MRNLRRAAAILSGLVGVTGVAAALVVGCGGDDTIVGYGGGDSGNDSSADVSSDVVTDSGNDVDSNIFEFDAGPPSLANFYHQINLTGCAWLQSCCGGASAFDMNACVADVDNPQSDGFLFTRTLSTVPDGGSVTFDDTKAGDCLTRIRALSCSTDLSAISSAEMIGIRDACYGAITGTIPAGGTGCTQSIECVPPAHCEATGGGTCVAPYINGTPCALSADDVDSLNRCGRAYEGTPGYCEIGPYTTFKDGGVCDSPQALSAPCYSPYECSSAICDNTNDPGHCASSTAIVSAPLCDFYAVDAGDGG